MATFIHQLADWPKFYWDQETISTRLAEVRLNQGIHLGRMRSLGFDLRQESVLLNLTQDVLKSSEIEGEHLNYEQVRSSVARRLGMDIGALPPADRHVEGVVEMMLDATQRFETALTVDRLYGWHAALFPTGYSGFNRITVGAWRTDTDGPMQVVSGPIGREQVHFVAPSADRLNDEMTAFLAWFNTHTAVDLVLTSAVAHLWFVTIHPFDDGNGRIARAIADLVLARSEQSAQRFYSMSAQIRKERDSYYDMLRRADSLDITPWLSWYLACLNRAIEGSQTILASVLTKARFWETHSAASINERQRRMLNALLDGFEGKLTSSKWAKITKTSQDTALRDIDGLVTLGLLVREDGGGRSTSYRLAKIE